MGMYDYIYADCPECGTSNEDQTKRGKCTLSSFWARDVSTLEEARLFVGADFYCKNCDILYEVTPVNVLALKSVKKEENYD